MRALSLDSMLVDAHLALASSRTSTLHFAEAEREFRVALAIDPNNATAHQWRGENFESLGRLEEGLVEVERAAELDPLSAVIANDVASGPYFLRHFAQAIVQARRVQELDSAFSQAYYTEGMAYLFSGHPDSAISSVETGFRVDSTVPGARGDKLVALAAGGRWADAASVRAAINQARDGASEGSRPSFDELIAALAFGATVAQRASLIRHIHWPDIIASTTNTPSCDPLLDPIKSDPAFIVAMQRSGMYICPARTPWPIKSRAASRVVAGLYHCDR